MSEVQRLFAAVPVRSTPDLERLLTACAAELLTRFYPDSRRLLASALALPA